MLQMKLHALLLCLGGVCLCVCAFPNGHTALSSSFYTSTKWFAHTYINHPLKTVAHMCVCCIRMHNNKHRIDHPYLLFTHSHCMCV